MFGWLLLMRKHRSQRRRWVATRVVKGKRGIVLRAPNYPRLRTLGEYRLSTIDRRRKCNGLWDDLAGMEFENQRKQNTASDGRALRQCETIQLAVNKDDLVYSCVGEPETFRASNSLSEEPLCIPIFSYPSPNRFLRGFPLHSSHMRTPSFTSF